MGPTTNPLLALIEEVKNREKTTRSTGAKEEKNMNEPNIQVGETETTDTEPTTELEKPNHTTQQMATTQNSSWY